MGAFPRLKDYPRRIVVRKQIMHCTDVFLWLLEHYGRGAGRSKQYLSVEAYAEKLLHMKICGQLNP